MDKKIIALLFIAVIAAVATTSVSYYVMSQPNQTQNNPSPTPTSMPTPTPTPASIPSPSQIPIEQISIPEPSVPEFTVEYVDNSYYVPPTYGVDEYSGETVQIGGGFTVTNKSIEVTIKNQQFTSYEFRDDGDIHQVSLHYEIAYKGHFGEDWHYTTEIVSDSSSYNTVILFGVECDISRPYYFIGPLSSGGKVDFQVQAKIGYRNYIKLPSHVMDPGVYEYIGETSGWSTT